MHGAANMANHPRVLEAKNLNMISISSTDNQNNEVEARTHPSQSPADSHRSDCVVSLTKSPCYFTCLGPETMYPDPPKTSKGSLMPVAFLRTNGSALYMIPGLLAISV